jgi:parallel beta-helix repeat protein
MNKNKMRIILVALGTVSVLVAAVPAQAATTLVVDDNLACPGATYSTIGAAVAAATAGDTIQVCAGIYHETVTVDKQLNFRGAKAGVDGRSGRGKLAVESVVDSPDGDFVLVASVNDVTINGFTLRGVSSEGHAAIEAYSGNGGTAGSGITVIDNVIRDNQNGMRVSNLDPSHPAAIRYNAFINNSLGTTGNGGSGIFITSGPANNTSIDHNSFTGHRETAINFAGSPDFTILSTGLVVSNNSSFNDSTFVVATDSDGALINNNTVKVGTGYPNGSGILDFGNNKNLRIVGNTVTGGSATGTSGIRIASFGDPNFGFMPSVGTTVQANVIRNRYNGIRLTANADISDNTVSGSVNVGILVEPVSSDNHLDGNTVSRSAIHDCEDDTIGTGTDGTANVWLNNIGKSNNSIPVGICPRPR